MADWGADAISSSTVINKPKDLDQSNKEPLTWGQNAITQSTELGPQKPPRSLFQYVDDAVRSAASGATGGWIDELAARLGPDDYETNLKREHARDEEISPYISYPGKVVGAVGTAVAAAPFAAASRVGQAAAKLPGWVKATGLGSLFGAISGAGEQEGEDGGSPTLEDRAIGGGIGAGTGAVVGTGLYGLGRGIQKTWKWGKNLLSSRLDPVGYAHRVVARTHIEDNTTPSKTIAALDTLGPKAMIADTGGTTTPGGEIVGGTAMRKLVSRTADVPGQGNRAGVFKTTVRQEGEGKRISKAVKDYLDPEDYLSAEEGLVKKLGERATAKAREIYDQFKGIPMTPELENFLKTSPEARSAVLDAAKDAARARATGDTKWLGPIDAQLTKLAKEMVAAGDLPEKALQPSGGISGKFSLETWDIIKDRLEKIVSARAAQEPLTGEANRLGRGVGNEVRFLKDQLTKLTGGEKSPYAAYLKEHGGDTEVLEALRAGKDKFMKMTGPEITKHLDGLSESGKAAFRSGAARAFLDTVEKIGDQTGKANRLFGDEAMRKRLAALDIVGEEGGGWANFAQRMRAEQRFSKTNQAASRAIGPGGLNAEEDAVRRAAGNVGAWAGSSAPLGHPLVTSRIGRSLMLRLAGAEGNPEVLRNISKTIFSQNPQEQLKALAIVDALIKSGKLKPPNQSIPTLMSVVGGEESPRLSTPLAVGTAGAVGGFQ